MTKYYVFYLLVIISNVSSFVCLAEVVILLCLIVLHPHGSLVRIRGVACIVLQRALHPMSYSNPPHVSLRSVSFQIHIFLVRLDFNREELLYSPIAWQPHLDCSRYSSA